MLIPTRIINSSRLLHVMRQPDFLGGFYEEIVELFRISAVDDVL